MSFIDKKRSLRDLFWEYPDFLMKLYSHTRPVGAIFISLFVGILLFFQLSNPLIFKSVSKYDKDVWSEGVIGTVQILNPIFINQNEVDRDIYELVYEKFLYIDQDGNPLPGVARKWEISEDGLSYKFTIAPDRVWHDGTPLSSHDVKFTFDKAVDVSVESGGNTLGSALAEISIETPNDFTVIFTLPERSATFFETISAYIVPQHLLESISNTDLLTYGLDVPPVGSGPYRIVSMNRKVIVLEAAEVTAYDPKIKKINYYMFDDVKSVEIAFRNGVLNGISGLQGKELRFLDEYEKYRIESTLLEHRKKMVFMNMSDPILIDSSIRKGLSFATNKEKILDDAVIDGEVAVGPLPSNSWAYNPEIDYYKYNLEEMDKLLVEAGYEKDPSGLYMKDGEPISLALTYLYGEQNEALAKELVKSWNDAGFLISLNPVEYNSLINEVLATRNYQLMLFELETTVDPDQYNLWHSLKKNYPDLNISGYEYNRVDLILERARVNGDRQERLEDYHLFQRYLMQDPPVIFLYEPIYNYIGYSGLANLSIEGINFPHERFIDIEKWEVE